ncbi:hypothetical protein PFICI_00521 [Pestalotiopsis fici W106-1]|uniref:Uncharacterized protein n=1 Tax=Pestalotiopsis fici (strain W106-1 / CGMCC3.15140) TaxID=1229662 RepID=W3XKV7_PESFW|nr:uncharacterized protein PFICI_00521 [Pestalotiopsis fici W106-1]ETS86693.1 hypothetical protein PFICI_00521 [Pestalotiopsis fici W106-1]
MLFSFFWAIIMTAAALLIIPKYLDSRIEQDMVAIHGKTRELQTKLDNVQRQLDLLQVARLKVMEANLARLQKWFELLQRKSEEEESNGASSDS